MTAGYWPDYVDGIVRIEVKPYDLEDIEPTSDDELDRMFGGNDNEF
jgi:hypothetical protein